MLPPTNNEPRLDETTQSEVPPGDSDFGKTDPPAHRGLELLSSSRPNLSDEISEVLRYRLRIASLLLFSGFLTFLLYRLLFTSVGPGLLEQASFWGHVGVTVITGMVGLRLCAHCTYLNQRLRMTEAMVFGSSAIFFVVVSLGRLLTATADGYIASINGPWLLLVFTYSLFVPNNWRRALAVIAPLALAPVGILMVAALTSEEFRQVLARPEFRGILTETFLSMTLAGAIATWGVRTTRSLRREAFEARQLGQYRLKHLLGSGGMGDVYVGEHLLLKRPCAIKVIRPEKAGDPQVLERFEREVQSTAKLTHWNTVDIYDYGRTDDGTFYYVMEYLPGLNLQELVDLHGSLSESRVIHLLTQTCEALSEAHSVGMVHRGLKPANIYAAMRGQRYDVAKLLDFGLVRPLTAPTDVALTQQNTIIGSPLFMAPEQAEGSAADARSDIYSMGVVAYFLLTGRTPFDGKTAIQVILAHATETPKGLARDGVSSDVEAVVMKCLEKGADDRFQSVDELRAAFDQCDHAGRWSWPEAADWWQKFGCPRKKEMDARIADGPTSKAAQLETVLN